MNQLSVVIALCLLGAAFATNPTNTLCNTANGYCDQHATCSPVGQYNVACACNAGYSGNGYWCQSTAPPVNLCATANGGCDVNAACYGGVGGAPVTCVCNTGYYPTTSGACVAVNACATNNGGCSAQASCSTTLATWDVTCTCNAGYTGNGWYCALPDQSNGGTAQQGGGNTGGPQFFPWDCPPNSDNFWNWRYNEPTCDSLVVDYPAALPDGQANDCNIRFTYSGGDFTLNFHNNNGVWSPGSHTFKYEDHPNWPANIGLYTVDWVQVGGSNCHWQGTPLQCGAQVPPTSTGTNDQPNWNWQYPVPECDSGVTVTYPSWLPSGQANDANVEVVCTLANGGTYDHTYNFHNNNGDWTGTHVFDVASLLPAECVSYSIVWVQVGGTNYHWTGSVGPCTP